MTPLLCMKQSGVLCFMQAQFGRRWTKIAKLVGSRSVLQVKSYARQYFKHKASLYLQHIHSCCITQNVLNFLFLLW